MRGISPFTLSFSAILPEESFKRGIIDTLHPDLYHAQYYHEHATILPLHCSQKHTIKYITTVAGSFSFNLFVQLME